VRSPRVSPVLFLECDIISSWSATASAIGVHPGGDEEDAAQTRLDHVVGVAERLVPGNLEIASWMARLISL